MALEATKAMAFSATCRLLHLLLIENHESICLLPRFATCPTDLHVAVIQALLSLATSVKSFDRPYLSSLADLLLDLFVFLRTQTMVPMAAFTQQMILTELLQSILSPVVQQRHDERSCRLRGQLYLPLLSFLTFLLTSLVHTQHCDPTEFLRLAPPTPPNGTVASRSLAGSRRSSLRPPESRNGVGALAIASPEQSRRGDDASAAA